MRNQRIIFFTDNAALVDVINKTTSRDPVIMGLVRQLVLACLKFNILFRAAHVPGLENHLADYSFSEILSTVLNHYGLDPTKYKGHSFRIGAATFAAESGFSDAQTRVIGRWKSDAFRKYIRTPSLTTAA